MQNTMLKSLVDCNENQNAPLPKIKDILQEEPLKTASAVVAKMAVRQGPALHSSARPQTGWLVAGRPAAGRLWRATRAS